MSSTTKIVKTALEIVYRKLASLKPYERNARTHSVSQIRKIKQSLALYGWTNSILVAGDDILAGHARHQAASELAREGIAIPRNADPRSAPTVDLSHLSAAERKAYIIADNKLAEEAGWDMSMLKLEFADLSLAGFDMTATGFDAKALAGIMGDVEEEERVLSADQHEVMDVAWQHCIREWRDILVSANERPWLTSTFTKGALAVHYLRALYLGDDIPRGASLAYTPHRVSTVGDQGAMVDAFARALEDGPKARPIRNSIRWMCGEKPVLDKIIGATTLPVHGHRVPGDFPALLARDLIDEFCPEGGTMLDPCHGWGGRMLGFLLSGAARYVGFDPSQPTHDGVQSMATDLIALTPARKKAVTLRCSPFEDAKLRAASCDFALTSPPYFDTEKYAGDASSWQRYATFEDWCEGFYRPLIEKTALALRRGAVFCLQVGSQSYPLRDRAIAFAAGFAEHVETRHTIMVNNHMETEPDEGEVIVVFRRR